MIFESLISSYGDKSSLGIVFITSVELELHFVIRININANIVCMSFLNLIASSIVSVAPMRSSTYKYLLMNSAACFSLWFVLII